MEELYITNQSGFFPNVTIYCLIFKKYTYIYIYIHMYRLTTDIFSHCFNTAHGSYTKEIMKIILYLWKS